MGAVIGLLLGCAPEEPAWSFSQADFDAVVSGYTSWASPPGWEGLNASCDGPHGTWLRLYADETASTETADSAAYAEGSTFVLESYQDQIGTWKMTVAMHKVAAESPLLGDWYWGQYDADGALLYAGDVPACWSCHQDAKDYGWHRGHAATECGEDTGAR